MPLIKIALDAMKAREMAKAVGLVPHPGSQWKWALRNMRDGRGDLLQGKPLGDAKLELGKLPNNVKQKLLSVVRRAGGDKEVSTVMKHGDPAWNQALATNKMNRSELGNYDPQKRMEDAEKAADPWSFLDEEAQTESAVNMVSSPFKQFRIGTTTNTAAASAKDSLAPGALSRAVHTHPYNPGLLNRISLQLKRQIPSPEDAPAGQEWAHERGVQHIHDRIQEAHRGVKLGPGVVAPSGSLARYTLPEVQRGFDTARANGAEWLPEKATMDHLIEAQPSGDYKSYLWHEQLHPHLTQNIVDPKFGYESVNRMRPNGGMRSIYFHREGK